MKKPKTKQAKAPTSALVRAPASDLSTPNGVQSILKTGLVALAELVSKDLPTPDLFQCLIVARETKKVLTDDDSGIEHYLKGKLVTLIKEGGKTTTDKGSMVLEAGDMEIEMSPYRTGLDPKKVAAALVQAGKKDLSECMTMVPTFVLPDPTSEKYMKLIAELGPAKLEQCRYAESWTLKTPTKRS